MSRDVALLLTACASSASAAGVHSVLSLRLAAGAGYDDNLLADGRGGDGMLALSPALRYRAEGPRLEFKAGYEARVWRFWTRPEDNADWHQLEAELRGTVGRDIELRLVERIRYADDPVGLARLGLLGVGVPSLRQLFRGEAAFPTTRRSALVLRARHELVHFYPDGKVFPSLLSGVNAAASISAEGAFRWDVAQRLRAETGYQLELFLDGLTLLQPAHGVHAQLAWRATRRWTLGALAGASWMNAEPPVETSALMPRAKLWVEWLHREGTLVAAASRDLTVGGKDARGAMLSDQLELALERKLPGPFTLHVASGLYRSGRPPHFAQDMAGYVATAALWMGMEHGLSAGLQVERFAILWGDVEPGRYDRNQVLAQVAWSHP